MYLSSSIVSFLFLLGATRASSTPNKTVTIDSTLTYLLPPTYQGNLSQNFLDTKTNNSAINDLFAAGRGAPFVSYDPEFLYIIGENATLELLAENKSPIFREAGVWLWDRNEVWFTTEGYGPGNASYLLAVNLNTSEVYTPNTSLPILNPNGGYYFNGTVYIAGEGTETEAPCIYAVTPATGETEVVVNTFFGLQFNGPNDVTWATRDGKAYMFFTDDPISINFEDKPNYQLDLPDAVWRFDPQERSLVPVISRADILIPNTVCQRF